MVCGSSFGEDKGNEYQAWFESFITKFANSHTPLTATERKDLQERIAFKPSVNTGQYYNLWFVKGFCMWVEETSPILNDWKKEKFQVLFAAMPELQNSGQFYHFYLDYVLKNLDDFMPILDDSEIKYIGYFKAAKPRALESDYQKWMTEYNNRKDDYGPIFDNAENLALRFLMDIKPASGEDNQTTYQVKRETLLKIRYLITNQQPNSAVAELDKILNEALQKPR